MKKSKKKKTMDLIAAAISGISSFSSVNIRKGIEKVKKHAGHAFKKYTENSGDKYLRKA